MRRLIHVPVRIVRGTPIPTTFAGVRARRFLSRRAGVREARNRAASCLSHTLHQQESYRATVDRTAGELSARCDSEGHNILTLNIADDVLTGKKTVQAARKAFSEFVVQDSLGQNPTYVAALQFSPKTIALAQDSDAPTIPGSPARPSAQPVANSMSGTGGSGSAAGGGTATSGAKDASNASTAEALAFVVAVDDNEILAASEAKKKKLGQEVMDYALMLHTEHGKNLQQTLKLAQKLNVVPAETAAVDRLRVQGAQSLSRTISLEGAEFSTQFIDVMVQGHREALELINNRLLNSPEIHAELQQHLTMTRDHIAAHLKAAQALQGMKTAQR